MGFVYKSQGNVKQSIINYNKSLRLYEQFGDEEKCAGVLNNLGIVYSIENETEQALLNFKKSLAINEKIKNKFGAANLLNSIGSIYHKKNDLILALQYYEKGLTIQQEIGDKEGVAISLDNIAALYAQKKEFEKALSYQFKSLAIQEEINDENGMIISLNNIGFTYYNQAKYSLALGYIKRAMKLSVKRSNAEKIKNAAQSLSNIYTELGNSDLALKNYKLYITMRDSIVNQENKKASIKSQLQYEYDKKAATDSIKAVEEKKVVAIQFKQEKTQRYALYGGLGLVLIFAGFIFNRFKITQKQKHIIEIKERETQEQNIIISKEKKRSEELLLNILPHEIAEELKLNGSAEATLHNQVSILFTDFKGFTQLSELLTAQELIAELNHCFIAFDHIMHKYDIEKIKTIGDAYMAASGLPIANPNHAQNIILAALEIRDFMNNYKQQRIQEGKKYFELRIGIHSGDVVAGIVGIKKFAYDVWGDTVNTASRMESSGVVGKVNISEATYNLVKTNFACEPRGFLEAKGKGAMNMYFAEKLNKLS